MVNPPEPLGLTLRVGALEPGDAKCAGLECPIGVGTQDRLGIGLVYLLSLAFHVIPMHYVLALKRTYGFEDFLRVTRSEDTLEDRSEAFWLADFRVPLDPERMVERLDCGNQLVRQLLRNGTKGALRSQGERGEPLGEFVDHGDREVSGPAESLFINPNFLVWGLCQTERLPMHV